MKLNIGKQTVEETSITRFKLVGNKLYLVNKFTPSVNHLWEDGKEFKIVPSRKLNDVIKRLTAAKNRFVKI